MVSMKRSHVRLVVCMLLPTFVLGCAARQMTGLQKQSLETETIEGKYQDIFRAVRNAFLNEGYTIKLSEIESGTLMFTRPYVLSSSERTQKNMSVALMVCPYTMLIGWLWRSLATENEGKMIEVTVTITEKGNRSELRTSFSGPNTTEEISQYGIMLKRLYATVREQVMIAH